MQTITGACTFDDIACKVAATVISHKPDTNTLVTDAGFTALSWDGFQANERFPLPLGPYPIAGHPELRYVFWRSLSYLTDLSLASLLWDIGKKNAPDVTPQNAASHLGLFCLLRECLLKKQMNKIEKSLLTPL